MKKFFKQHVQLIVIMCLLISGVTINTLFSGYKYDSDIECIESGINMTVNAYNETLFKLEDESKELIYYKSKGGYIIRCELKKKNIFGETKYKFVNSATSTPDYLSQKWLDFNDNIKYVAVKYKNDINYIDCEGYEPVGTYIPFSEKYASAPGCWVYVIDKSK